MDPDDPSPDPPSDDDLDFGPTLRGLRAGLKVFGRYSLERPLGKGGMGEVWLARDETLEEPVALKFLLEGVRGDEAALDELKRETKRSLKLTHKNIVRIADLREDGPWSAIVMEYVDGETLTRRRLAKESRVMEVEEIRPWIRQLCEALTYAHEEARVVHRDLKPGNLMVDGAGRLRVLDFGIAGTLTDSQSRLSPTGRPPSGTLVYMSPQQAMGYPPSVADDLYSLGATIYELLTGKPPFYRGNIQHQIETVAAPAMSERREQLGVEGTEAIPEAWERVVAACLAKEAKDRPASAAAVWAELTAGGTEAQEAKPSPTAAQTAGERPEPVPAPPRKPPVAKPERPPVSDSAAADSAAKSRKMRLIGLVSGVAVMVGLGVWGLASRSGQGPGSAGQAPGVGTAAGGRTVMALETGAIGDSQTFDLAGGEQLVVNYVPGGVFTMGSPPGEVGRDGDEDQVTATLSRHFWLGETEVTQGQWEAVMGPGSNPSVFMGSGRLPADTVSWDEAQAFVARLNGMGGLPAGWAWSLPTEAQWERACRAGTETAWSFGDDERALGEHGWHDDNSGSGTQAVRGAKPNPWGLYDLHGNVWEWCLDPWDGESPLPGGTDPVGDRGAGRVLRGGSWIDPSEDCRSSGRFQWSPSYRDNILGLRVALRAQPGFGMAGATGAVAGGEGAGAPAGTPPPDGTRGGGTSSPPSWETAAVGDSRAFDLGGGEQLVMKHVPGGTFTMGSRADEAGRPGGEAPVTVTLSRPFWLGETEVTQGQWEAVMGPGSNPSQFAGDPALPVDSASWDEAQAFVARLNGMGGLPAGWAWSLPTEAQWERACRAGTETAWSFGDDERALGEHGWYEDNSGQQTHPVRGKQPNPWGLYDLHGNVWEWCLDRQAFQASLAGGTDPVGRSGSYQVFRGGGWFNAAASCRASSRITGTATFRERYLGLRVALASGPGR